MTDRVDTHTFGPLQIEEPKPINPELHARYWYLPIIFSILTIFSIVILCFYMRSMDNRLHKQEIQIRDLDTNIHFINSLLATVNCNGVEVSLSYPVVERKRSDDYCDILSVPSYFNLIMKRIDYIYNETTVLSNKIDIILSILSKSNVSLSSK